MAGGGKKTFLIGFGVICVLLVILNIATYSYYNSKLTASAKEKETLLENAKQLQAEIDKMKFELASTKEQTATGKQAFVDYKKLLREYVSISQVVLTDVEAISLTTNEMTQLSEASDYIIVEGLVDLYESQLNSLKTHLAEYKKLLTDNKESFEEIGVNTRDEINKSDQSVQLFDKALQMLRDALAST